MNDQLRLRTTGKAMQSQTEAEKRGQVPRQGSQDFLKYPSIINGVRTYRKDQK